MYYFIYITLFFLTCTTCYANNTITDNIVLQNNSITYTIIIIFIICYMLIIFEEIMKIKKSTIVIISSSIMWILIFFYYNNEYKLNNYIKIFLLEYCELFLFLFVAMIYINSIKYFGILNTLKNYIILKKLSYKKIFWLTGILSFIISPIADNLTTSLIMCSIILSIDKTNKHFINMCCINIVIASNAGGAFSPFGDITTLMIWQNGILPFKSFFLIFIPSLITFLIPSIIMTFYIPNTYLTKKHNDINTTSINFDSITLIILFLITITITILSQIYFNIPSALSMMTGLGLLQLFEYFKTKQKDNTFNITKQICNIEWETLLFFYGIMLCINALSAINVLDYISNILYNELWQNHSHEYKHILANIIIGIMSAIIDNIPITLAIIKMNPSMHDGNWLLITLAIGTGGSLLSIGSASGIALMGLSKNNYTFLSHLKWSFVIFIGYIFGIFSHIIINNNLFI